MNVTARPKELIEPHAEASTPTVVIQPARTLFNLDLPALWDYRELVYFMVWRDLKTRYKQTALGVGWAILQPFLTMLIFTAVFARIVPMPSHGIPYPLFVFSALVPWLYFSQAVSRTGAGLVMNANLISKVYFPRLIVPLAAATTPLTDLLLGLVLLFGIMAWYQFLPPPEIVFLPAFSLMAFAAAFAFGLWLAALNVRYRDVGHMIPFLVQIGMFASPVIYPVSLVPEKWQGIYALNPMVAVIEGYRWSLLGAPPPDLGTMAIGTLSIVVFLLGGLVYFKSTERTFADLI